jgi:DNA-binding CsgD family transcriptional regulator
MMAAENRLDRLTDRQKDCLSFVAKGYTSKEIGRLLGLSPSTVDNHVLASMHVLDAPSRAVAARMFSAHDDRQKIPSQSPALANAVNSATMHPVAEASSWSRLGKLAFELPPIGGQRNDLDWTERTFRILQVAVLSLGIFLSLALLIAGAFSIFS